MLQDEKFYLSEIIITFYISPLPVLSLSFLSHLNLGSRTLLNIPSSQQHKAYTEISTSSAWVVWRLSEYFRTEG